MTRRRTGSIVGSLLPDDPARDDELPTNAQSFIPGLLLVWAICHGRNIEAVQRRGAVTSRPRPEEADAHHLRRVLRQAKGDRAEPLTFGVDGGARPVRLRVRATPRGQRGHFDGAQTTPVNEGDMIAVASTLTRVERITLGPPDSDGRLILRTIV